MRSSARREAPYAAPWLRSGASMPMSRTRAPFPQRRVSPSTTEAITHDSPRGAQAGTAARLTDTRTTKGLRIMGIGGGAEGAARRALHVAVTGASGLIGSALRSLLRAAGHRVSPLVRRSPAHGEIGWDPDAGRIDAAGLEDVDAVVHLAGESIADGR